MVLAIALFVTAAPASAQLLRLAPVGAGTRDLAVDTERARLYLSNYDDGSLTRLDAETGAVLDVLPTGPGAAALAISSNGRVLACVNRLDRSVSLITLEDGVVFATATVGSMPADIAALPGGGFAVPNAFSDSISIIDEVSGEVTAELTTVASVPSAIAASTTHLAIAARATSSLVIIAPDQAGEGLSVPFEAPVVALESLEDGRFVASTGDTIYIVSATGSILARADADASLLTVHDNTIAAAGAQGVTIFDSSLNQTLQHSSAPVAALGAGGGALFAATASELLTVGEFQPVLAASPEPAETSAISSESLISSEAPVVPIEDSQTQEPEIETVPIDEPAPAPEAEPAVPPVPQEVEETPAPLPQRPVYRALRLGYISQRPHAPFLGYGAAEKFQGDLRNSLQIEGEHAGLLGLDWQRNPEPERFDSWVRSGATDTFEGDVEFHVDDAVVRTQSMQRDDDTGEITMRGGVSVERDTDSFRAHYLQVRAPENRTEREELEGVPIVPRGYRPPRHIAYAGNVQAENVEWHEPFRDLEAKTLRANLDAEDVHAEDIHGRAGGLFFNANELTIAGANSVLADQVWITTCDRNPPHYTLNFKNAQITDGVLRARNARLELWGTPTPLVIPRLQFDPNRDNRRYRPDLEIGSSSDIGQYVNLGQWFSVSPYMDLGVRTMPTSRDGFGYGLDAEYDFRLDPRTPLFRSEGSLRSLHTTNDRGYVDYRHQQDLTLKTRFVGQVQQWSDEDFLNDWFHDDFENQNGPRTFANFTHTRPGQILTLTASPSTHDFLEYSEKLPEASYHLLDRQIVKNLYLSLDSFAGYYELDPAAITTERAVNIARLSYDIQLGQALNILPFIEGDYTIYEDRLVDEASEERFGFTGGVTFQSRLQRTMGGIGPYDKLKHIVVPSVTYVYRPNPSGDASRVPQLDGLDFRPGRERVEGKIENVLLAKHAETGDIWQLARFAIYAGTDFESEIGTSDDIELEFAFRPIPKWGLYASGEHHDAESGGGVAGGEFNRALTYIFYDNAYQSNTFNARLGYAYSDLDAPLDQRELLYGAGVRLGKKWSFGFEHRLELENNEITRETYELRRLMHDWELAIRVRDREEGVDASVSITLIDFPTASLKF